jgi:adenylyltransferase/sulfurtransferase
MTRFSLTTTAVDTATRSRETQHAGAGALVIFEGRVRNENEGRAVLRLEYEAYEALCLKEGERILCEAIERFSLLDASCVHRTGALQLGEVAVWVGTLAAHRGEAFDACRWIIDEIKMRLPIWKREHYVDGEACWVRCQACAAGAAAHDHRHTIADGPHA